MQSESKYLQQIRKLIFALIASGAFNILLLAFIFYLFIQERPPTPYFESKPIEQTPVQVESVPVAVADSTNADIITHFKTLPVEQLITKLNNKEMVESGYTQCDLALGCLVTFHYFDLSRALLGHQQPTQHRAIQYGVHRDGKPARVLVYPGLSDEQFHAIQQFAKMEKWPLTSRGLFLLVHRNQKSVDPSLAEAFYLTPEFLAVEMLFNRAEVSTEKAELLKMLAEGNWQTLHSFSEEQRVSQDLSPARRQQFLLNYIKQGSKPAADLLLKTDFSYAVDKLDDTQAIKLLQILTENTPKSQQFAKTLLASPRGDVVWQKAAERLYAYAGEIKPEYNHHVALSRFVGGTVAKNDVVKVPEVTPQQPQPLTPTPQPAPAPVKKVAAKKKAPSPSLVMYEVQEGDSLWKIAKKENVDFETLKSANTLDSDFLMPGMLIMIPNNAKPFTVEKEIIVSQPPPPQPKPAPVVPSPPSSPPKKPVLVKTKTILKEGTSKKHERLHIVQDGDSLWKIARRYNVETDDIKKLNHLGSDLLKPGTVLRIPQN